MEYTLSPVTDFVIIFLLVLLNGIFIAAEFALVRSNPLHLKSADGRRRLGSRTSLRLIEDMDLSLSATQLGIAMTSIVLGWWGEATLYSSFIGFANGLAAPRFEIYTHGVATFFALCVVVYLNVVIGELAAKSFAIRSPEGTLRYLSGFVLVFSQLLRPFIYVLNRSAEIFLKLFGIRRAAHLDRVHSLAELTFLVSKSTEGGLLDKEEEQMVRGVFGLSETVAREVMTPRTDLIAVPVEATFEEVIAIVRESGLSRFPVTGDSDDDVLGILLARDLLSFVVPGFLHPTKKISDFSVRKLMREPYFVQGTKPIDDLLAEFKRRKLHLAIVMDEHGGVDGVVTLEDLIEEIVGDIFDESDFPEKSIIVQDNGEVLIDGGQLIADLNSQFSLEIPEGDYDTIAGFIFTSLGRMPRPGDKIVVNRADSLPAKEELESGDDGREDGSESENSPVSPEDSEESAKESPISKALITVEKVQSYRIETVRLTPHFSVEESESTPPNHSSKPLNSVSDREV